MKISCQSCQAKYTIADEKVQGKVVKIRCKKCGTTIVVNGSEQGAGAGGAVAAVASSGAGISSPPPEQEESTRVYDYTKQAAAGEEWTIAVSEGDQRTVTTAQIVDLYNAGTINGDSYAWKDGMGDWLPLSEIEALQSIIAFGPRPTMTPDLPGQGFDPAPAAQPAPAPAAAPLATTAPNPIAAAPRAADRAGAAGGMFGAAASPGGGTVGAARRQGGRGGSTDLFGTAASAGGDDDVMTSASTNPQVSDSPERMTGARNENSVLFSLSALSATPGSSPPSPMAGIASEASGIIDIKNLMGAASAGNGSKPKSKVDDIMNLGGGGVFAPTLAAPILAPPAGDFGPPADAGHGAAGAQKKGLLMGLAAGGALVLIAGLGFSLLGGKKDDAAPSASSLAAASATAPMGTAPATAALTAHPADSATAAVGSAEAPSTAPAATAAVHAAAEPTAVAPGAVAAAPAAPKPAEEKAPKPAAVAAAPAAPKPAAPAEKPAAAAAAAAPAPATGADFDRSAALSALSAAASSAQSCKKADGPTGAGRIAVTFAPSGSVTTANVEGPPFAGTPVGGCVAARFRGAHVPPFGGGTITVHKSFSIN